MSASPFRTTTGPFLEVPVPTNLNPDDVRTDLEDVPFDAEIQDFPISEEQMNNVAPVKRFTWFHRIFAGRSERKLREEKLVTELQDLRASYAGLLNSTEDIKDRLETGRETHQSVTKALSPFPAAIASIEQLQTRQQEASEILTDIRERVDTTADRDDALLSTMDSVHGGVGKLQGEVGAVHTDVKKVTLAVSDIAVSQASVSADLGDFGKKMDIKFEQAEQSARENAERLGQSGDDVLIALRKMEKSSQRNLWVFASLLTVLFITLIAFSAKISKLGSVEPEASEATEEIVASSELSPSTPVTEFEF